MQVEERRWKYAGAKEQRAREVLGWSATRRYQVLPGAQPPTRST